MEGVSEVVDLDQLDEKNWCERWYVGVLGCGNFVDKTRLISRRLEVKEMVCLFWSAGLGLASN